MLTLDPHQIEAVQYLVSNPRNMLADKPGVGKTAPSIVAASMCEERLFVGCPAVGVTHWKRQVKTWWPHLPESDLLVVSHNSLAVSKKTQEAVQRFKSCGKNFAVIIDEAHRARNRSSKTAQAYYGSKCDAVGGLIEQVECVWPLSGTPKPNNSGELWTHLRALRPDLITIGGKILSYQAFIERYTDFSWTEYGPRFWGNKKATLPELKAIVSKFMLRRSVGSIKLPPLNWEHVIVDPVAAADTLRKLQELEASPSISRLQQSLAEAESVDQEFVWSSPDSHLAELRRVIGEIKAPVVGKMIAEELADNAYAKIVVFAHHHSVIEQLHAEFLELNPVVLTGKTSKSKRDHAIDQFQENPNVRVFIGQMDACGELITLTAADQVAFVEDSWVPDVVLQCAKRCHRRGQDRPVFVRMFGLANSIDEGTTRVRVRKSKMDSELLN